MNICIVLFYIALTSTFALSSGSQGVCQASSGTQQSRWAPGYTGALYSSCACDSNNATFVWTVRSTASLSTISLTFANCSSLISHQIQDFDVRCQLDKDNCFRTVLGVNRSLTYEDTETKVSFQFRNISWNVTMSIADCSQCSSDTCVHSTAAEYGATGAFYCPSEGELHFSNGTRLTNNGTTCLSNAKWKNEKDMQCWSAPYVELSVPTKIKEGTQLTATCNVTHVFPASTRLCLDKAENCTKFDQDASGPGTTQQLTKTFQISRADNHKEISCYAENPYTVNYGGYFQSAPLNVVYRPYSDSVGPTVCNWTIDETNSTCYLTIASNPRPANGAITREGKSVTGYNISITRQPGTDRYELSLTFNKVTSGTFGTYTVTVNNSEFVADFQLVITLKSTPITTTTSSAMYAGIVAGVVGACVLATAAGFLIRRMQVKKQGGNTDAKISRRNKEDSDVEIYPGYVKPISAEEAANVDYEGFARNRSSTSEAEPRENSEVDQRNNPYEHVR